MDAGGRLRRCGHLRWGKKTSHYNGSYDIDREHSYRTCFEIYTGEMTVGACTGCGV